MKAAALAKEAGGLGIEASSMSRAALGLAGQNKFAEAEQLCRSTLSVDSSSGQPLNIYQTYSGMCLILKCRKNTAMPFLILKKHLNHFQSQIYVSEVYNSYLAYSECLENTENYNKAISIYKLATQ